MAWHYFVSYPCLYYESYDGDDCVDVEPQKTYSVVCLETLDMRLLHGSDIINYQRMYGGDSTNLVKTYDGYKVECGYFDRYVQRCGVQSPYSVRIGRIDYEGRNYLVIVTNDSRAALFRLEKSRKPGVRNAQLKLVSDTDPRNHFWFIVDTPSKIACHIDYLYRYGNYYVAQFDIGRVIQTSRRVKFMMYFSIAGWSVKGTEQSFTDRWIGYCNATPFLKLLN